MYQPCSIGSVQDSQSGGHKYISIGPYSRQQIPCYCSTDGTCRIIPTADSTKPNNTKTPTNPTLDTRDNTEAVETPTVDSDAISTAGFLGMGTMVFKPLEVRFPSLKEGLPSRIQAYCQVKLGLHSERTAIMKGEGTESKWEDSVALKYKGQDTATVKIKEKSVMGMKNKLGEAEIQLRQAVCEGKVDQWIPLCKKGKEIGEIHMMIEFIPESL